MIRAAEKNPAAVFRGTGPIAAVYWGDRQVWPEAAEGFGILATETLYYRLTGRDVTIDFGDGTVLGPADYGSLSTQQVHTFPDSREYHVTFTGDLTGLSFTRTSYTALNGGLLEVLTPLPAQASCMRTFAYCPRLRRITGNLFQRCGAVTNFHSCFAACPSLTAVPAGLFDPCAAGENFGSCFMGCSGLTSLPAGLFWGCTSANYYVNCFAACTSLASLPERLFRTGAAVRFSSCFERDPIAALPPGLFAGCPGATELATVFLQNTALTAIPAALFDACPAITDLSGAFQGCTALTGPAPALWERTGITSHSACFRDCTGLQNYGSIPSDWR